MNRLNLFLASVLCLVALGALQATAGDQQSNGLAQPEQQPPAQTPYIGSETFERMKQLAGSWEGMMDKGEGPMKITASYKLTAGGSAIVETLFEGTPHEMVTVYYDASTHKLGLTHYCMLRNRPKMIVHSVKMNEVSFELIPNSGINAAKDDHMHSLTINFESPDTIIQHWTRFAGGKKKEVVDLAFHRVKNSKTDG
jgi:hypothetical protein